MFIGLKPLAQGRKLSANQVIGRLRKKLAVVPGGMLYLRPCGTCGSAAGWRTLYQYTLQSQDLDALNHWGPLMLEKMRQLEAHHRRQQL
jgi:multidrug efflux pump subunit AcrB